MLHRSHLTQLLPMLALFRGGDEDGLDVVGAPLFDPPPPPDPDNGETTPPPAPELPPAPPPEAPPIPATDAELSALLEHADAAGDDDPDDPDPFDPEAFS